MSNAAAECASLAASAAALSAAARAGAQALIDVCGRAAREGADTSAVVVDVQL